MVMDIRTQYIYRLDISEVSYLDFFKGNLYCLSVKSNHEEQNLS